MTILLEIFQTQKSHYESPSIKIETHLAYFLTELL